MNLCGQRTSDMFESILGTYIILKCSCISKQQDAHFCVSLLRLEWLESLLVCDPQSFSAYDAQFFSLPFLK